MCLAAWKVDSDPEDETDCSSLVISDFSLSQNPVEALLKQVVGPQLQSFQGNRPRGGPKNVYF